MDIKHTDNGILLRLPSEIDTISLQRFINYLKYKEATMKSDPSQEMIDELADESKTKWWKKNKNRFLK